MAGIEQTNLKAVPDKRPSLRQKLVAAIGEIERVEKRGENTMQRYKYVMAADIIDAARKALANHGIAFLATEEEIKERGTYETKSGATMSVVWVRMKFLFMDADSEEVLEIVSTGEGQDTGDKSIYKAKTGAIKYALQQTLLMSTGDDPEDDKGEQVRGQWRPPAQAQPPQPARVIPCPTCGHATALTHKRDGTWACFSAKGGCEAVFTQERLDELLAGTNPTPPNKNASGGGAAQAMGTPEDEDIGFDEAQEAPKRERLVATDEQIKQVIDLIQQSRVPDETHAWVLKGSAVNQLADLNPTQATWWIENLTRRVKETQGANGNKKARK